MRFRSHTDECEVNLNMKMRLNICRLCDGIRRRLGGALHRRCLHVAALIVGFSACPFLGACAESGPANVFSHDVGLRRTTFSSGVEPECPSVVQTDKLAFADFAFDSYSQTPSFWAYVPERCNVGLFGKVSLEDGHWTYFGAFAADEKLTHYTLGNSGDFHFFTMAGVDSDDDDDGVPDSVASLCTDGGNDPSHGSGGTTPLLPVSPRLSATPLPKGETAVLAETSKFLYSGSNPVQTGVDSDAIEPRRVSVIRGRVLDGDGSPMFGAVITVHGHPEFGETISRADG